MRVQDVKIGMKVKISEKPKRPNDRPSWVNDMDEFKGLEAEVVEKTSTGYFLLRNDDVPLLYEYGCGYVFAARWLEKA